VHIDAHEMQHPAQKEFEIPRRILKSHHLQQLGGYRLLYLFREPADTLVSYYHFHRLQEGMRHQVTGGLDQFCDHMIDGWCEHVERALAYFEKSPEETLFVSYESLANDGPRTLAKAVRFLGIEADPPIISEALERNAFSKLRRKEECARAGASEFFFRKGKIGSARDELSNKTLDRINHRAKTVYERAQNAALAGA
jgi:hypothetical protein